MVIEKIKIMEQPKHRELEERFSCRENSLKEAVEYLISINSNLDEVVEGCRQYSHKYGLKDAVISPFEAGLNLYVTCLKQQNEKTQPPQK